jgi:hypothetical protein
MQSFHSAEGASPGATAASPGKWTAIGSGSQGTPQWPAKPHRGGWHEAAMQLDLSGHPAQAGSKRARPAIAGYDSLVGNRVSQKGNSRGLAGLYLNWCRDLPRVLVSTSTG